MRKTSENISHSIKESGYSLEVIYGGVPGICSSGRGTIEPEIIEVITAIRYESIDLLGRKLSEIREKYDRILSC